jgi:xanthine dehydrogenase small subunit
MDPIQLTINHELVEIKGLPPHTTLLQYLREHALLRGTKEGCAEGDCGACTVALLEQSPDSPPQWRAINACLLLLPMLDGKEIITVEGLTENERLHPVQETLVNHFGSQCGYCTPGVVMTMFEACYRTDLDTDGKLDDQMCGTLCRCTGYRPIKDATKAIAGLLPADSAGQRLEQPLTPLRDLTYGDENHLFIRPASMETLWSALKDHPDARLVAGATDLGLDVTKKHQTWPVLIGLDGIPALQEILESDTEWSIGGAVPLSHLEHRLEDALPALVRMLRYFGSRQIKNRATVGGNLCNASPIGDLAPILLALNAEVTLSSREAQRSVPLDSFFLDYRKTALREGEILSRITIPKPAVDARVGSYKVSKRRELDISAVAAGCFLRLDSQNRVEEIRLGYGGMAATPKRATHTEQALLGQEWSQSVVKRAMESLEKDFQPLTDHRATAWYRGKVAKNLLLGFYLETLNSTQAALGDHPSGTIVLEAAP